MFSVWSVMMIMKLQSGSSLPLSAMRGLLRKAGASRVGDDAQRALRMCLEDYALVVGEKALRLARHAGRKTVRAQDVRLAAKA